MPFTKINKPVVGEAITEAGLADLVIENLDSHQAALQKARINISNSSFEFSSADGKPVNWKVIKCTVVSSFTEKVSGPVFRMDHTNQSFEPAGIDMTKVTNDFYQNLFRTHQKR